MASSSSQIPLAQEDTIQDLTTQNLITDFEFLCAFQKSAAYQGFLKDTMTVPNMKKTVLYEHFNLAITKFQNSEEGMLYREYSHSGIIPYNDPNQGRIMREGGEPNDDSSFDDRLVPTAEEFNPSFIFFLMHCCCIHKSTIENTTSNYSLPERPGRCHFFPAVEEDFFDPFKDNEYCTKSTIVTSYFAFLTAQLLSIAVSGSAAIVLSPSALLWLGLPYGLGLTESAYRSWKQKIPDELKHYLEAIAIQENKTAAGPRPAGMSEEDNSASQSRNSFNR